MKLTPLLLGVVCTALVSTAASAAKRPNIIFIFTDDHCQQATSAYGGDLIHTPGMDRIGKEGVRFNRCYNTNAICGPSRAVIQTGKYSHLNGFVQNGNTFDGSQQTFPKLLQHVGYQTAVIGKWHLKSTPEGYDHYEVLVGQGPYYNPPMKFRQDDGTPGNRKHTGYTTDIISDLTLDWLKNARDADKPFMLMTQHKAPHRNWMPGPKYLNWLDDKTIPEPETLFDNYEGRTSAAAEQTMTIKKHMNPNDLKLTGGRGLTPEQKVVWDEAYAEKNAAFAAAKDSMSEKELIQWKYQRYVKDYLRCVRSVDDAIVELLTYLDESGLAENTLVMYSSDQGWYLGEHGWFDKRWMYEESLKTPLLARWPGTIPSGQVREELVSNLDFAETFLAAAGASIPGDVQGKDLLPLMKGEKVADWQNSFYYHYYEFPGAHSVARHYGVTNGDHKLIHFYQKGEWELFDLKADPNELKSVYGTPGYAKIEAGLKAELARLRKLYQVPDKDPVQAKRKKKAPKKKV